MINFYEWNRTFKSGRKRDTAVRKVTHKGILVNGNHLNYYESIKAKRMPAKRPTQPAAQDSQLQYQYQHNFFMNSAIKSRLKSAPKIKLISNQHTPQSKDRPITLHQYLYTHLKGEASLDSESNEAIKPRQNKRQLSNRQEKSCEHVKQSSSRQGIHILTQNQRSSYRKYKFEKEKRYKTLPTHRSDSQGIDPAVRSNLKSSFRMISLEQIFSVSCRPPLVHKGQQDRKGSGRIKVYESYRQLSSAKKKKRQESVLKPKSKQTMILPWSQQEQDEENGR